MGELGQGVGLVHELGELGAAEELLDRRRYGPDVDEVGGHGRFHILQAHALAHYALQARHAHADLVLQQLAHAADAAVAQMVDVVRATNAVAHADQVADGGNDIIRDDVPGDQLVHAGSEQGFEARLIQPLAFIQHGH